MLCRSAVRVFCSTASLDCLFDVLWHTSGVFCIVILWFKVPCCISGMRAGVGVFACSMYFCYLAFFIVFGFS